VPAGPDDAPFLLKVRWLLEALFHPLRAAPFWCAENCGACADGVFACAMHFVSVFSLATNVAF
jgi:hypothetical protein